MNRSVATILLMLVLLVGLAEIYLALSWDEHNQERGRWSLRFNWTLHTDSNTPPLSWARFIYASQKSTSSSINTTVLEAENFNARMGETENTLTTMKRDNFWTKTD